MRQGMEAFEDGEFGEALAHFHAAQLDHPDDRRLEFNIADSYYRLADYAAAEQSFGRVLSLGGDDDLAQQAYYNLGNTLYQQGRLDEAIEAYEQALVLDPEDEDARHNLEFVQRELEQRQQQCEQRREQQQQNPQQQQNREQHEETRQEEQQQSAEAAEQQQASEQEMINVDPTREAQPDEPQVEGPPPVQLTPEEADRLLDALDEQRPDMRQQQRRKQKDKDW